MKIPGKKFLFDILTFCLVITLLELFLTIVCFFSPMVNVLLTMDSISPSVPDERLGHRPNPALPGHDDKGFRNASVPDEAKIVALGDSQTYGDGVFWQDAWPSKLEELSGDTVYSMAFGGYGPAHSLILWEEAALFNPRIYIEAFYSGNDLFDSFNLVYNLGQLPELKTANKEIELEIREMEKAESVAQHVSNLYKMGKNKKGTLGYYLSLGDDFFSSHSNIYVLLRRAKRELFRLIESGKTESDWGKARTFAEENSDYCQAFEDGPFKTIFTPDYRLTALDLEDRRIAEGYRISLEAIKRMNELALQQERQFLVVLIPTKELVFKELIRNPSEKHLALIRNEELLWKKAKEFFRAHDIDFVDGLAAFREMLSQGIQPYLVSHDGHPNEYGHYAIAGLIYTKLLKNRGDGEAGIRGFQDE